MLLCLAALYSFWMYADDRMLLNGNWQFLLSDDEKVSQELIEKEFYSPSFDAAGFHAIPVPSNWAVLGFEEPVYRGFDDDKASEGFYIRRFDLPSDFADKRLLLNFGGVWASAEVWVNGTWVGRHDSGFTSFGYDVSGLLKGGQNTLAVRVRQTYPGYKTDVYDDWTLGGIYRDVSIVAMPAKRWIDDVAVKTTFTSNYANANVSVNVIVADEHKTTRPGNYPSQGTPYDIRVRLISPDGKLVHDSIRHMAGHPATSRYFKEDIYLPEVKTWNAETPYLYRLSVELLENGQGVQAVEKKVGIREVSTEGGVFKINGCPVKLRGVNCHDEWPDVGRATTPEHWLKDLTLMKAANINFIRACHYQHSKGFIEMCDSIGMYVGAEVSLGGASRAMYDPGFISDVMLRTQETVERDIDNPSIIYWSVGNEDPFTYMHLRAVRTINGIDGTRPCLLPWNADVSLPSDIGILAPHYWTAAEYDSLCRIADRPVITTEYTHAYGTHRFGGLHDRWKALAASEHGAGGAVWMWADQGISTSTLRDEKKYGGIEKKDRHLRISAAGWDGITDSYRNPTRDYHELKAVYCPVYPLTETIDIENGQQAVALTLYNGYDFTDLNTVNVEWRLFTDDRKLDEGSFSLDAAPHTSASKRISFSRPLRIRQGQTVFLHLRFIDNTGMEIGTKAVELVGAHQSSDTGKFNVSLNETSDVVTLKAGSMTCAVSKATGLPATVAKGGKAGLSDVKPALWHKFNDGDMIISNRKLAKGVDYSDMPAKVLSFDTSIADTAAVIKAKVIYEINDSNIVNATYCTTIRHDGSLSIDYELTPCLQVSYLPVVGLEMRMPTARSCTRWLGKGPHDAYPNKNTATILGVWNGKDMTGTHDTRWAEIGNLRVTVDGYIDRDDAGATIIRMLSHVLGRSEKGRLNDTHYQLPTGKTYSGRIVVR